MDLSSIYIKMCEKAEEIQSLRGHYNDGHNFVQDIPQSPITVIGITCRVLKEVWLPRQDQLQKMVSQNRLDLATLWLRFRNYVDVDLADEAPENFEQIWLRFVMKENHNKSWNGEDWI